MSFGLSCWKIGQDIRELFVDHVFLATRSGKIYLDEVSGTMRMMEIVIFPVYTILCGIIQEVKVSFAPFFLLSTWSRPEYLWQRIFVFCWCVFDCIDSNDMSEDNWKGDHDQKCCTQNSMKLSIELRVCDRIGMCLFCITWQIYFCIRLLQTLYNSWDGGYYLINVEYICHTSTHLNEEDLMYSQAQFSITLCVFYSHNCTLGSAFFIWLIPRETTEIFSHCLYPLLYINVWCFSSNGWAVV